MLNLTFRFDKGLIDPLRIRGGIGYIMKSVPLRVELIYHVQYTNPDGSGLKYTDNIFRLNILSSGLILKTKFSYLILF